MTHLLFAVSSLLAQVLLVTCQCKDQNPTLTPEKLCENADADTKVYKPVDVDVQCNLVRFGGKATMQFQVDCKEQPPKIEKCKVNDKIKSSKWFDANTDACVSSYGKTYSGSNGARLNAYITCNPHKEPTFTFLMKACDK